MCCVTKSRRRGQTDIACGLKQELRLGGDVDGASPGILSGAAGAAALRKMLFPDSTLDEGRDDIEAKRTCLEGDSCTGQYRHGVMHGVGQYEWTSGAIYDGDLVEGRLEGTGTLTWPDASRYEGSWKNGRMHGLGRFSWPDGRSYEGEYLNDKKHGQGVFRWPNGSKYAGPWKDGLQHGRGGFTSSNGSKKTFEFVAGRRVQGAR